MEENDNSWLSLNLNSFQWKKKKEKLKQYKSVKGDACVL